MTQVDPQIHYRTCHLCEAMCGLEITTRGQEIEKIIGDNQDPFSQGHICPKAAALSDIQSDPDRLRQPHKRVGDQWQPITWEAAFEETISQLCAIRDVHGPNSIGTYAGNPSVHNYGILTHSKQFLGQLETRNRYSASSVDQLPHQLVAHLMYGHQFMVPVPDIDRTQHLFIIGANPLVSNGSLMSAPGIAKRLRAIQARGGKIVVIDPRRTETAHMADEHHFIRPGTDAMLLAGMLRALMEADKLMPERLIPMLDGFGEAMVHLEAFSPDLVASVTGIGEGDLRRMAMEFADAPSAVCYGRMGTSTQPFGALCQWLIQLLNIATANLDKAGGAMFTKPAFDIVGNPKSNKGHFGQWWSRVRHLPEFSGELPAATMAEEILTKGQDQIRAMITVAGNPILSVPNGRRLERAFDSLDFMVSLDFYINETTRHANIILPPTAPLEHDHYDMIFHIFGVRNTAKYSPAVFDKPTGSYHDWEIFSELATRLAKRLGKTLKQQPQPSAIIDYGISHGPYGTVNNHPEALNLEKLKSHPHGIDLGPLEQCLPDRLATENKRIRCSHPYLLYDLERCAENLEVRYPPLVLISKRHLRSNNSWMHNYPRLTKGKPRCRLYIHPHDLHRYGLQDGETVMIRSRVGKVTVMLQRDEDMMPGVVCMPHGWGHRKPGVQQRNAVETEMGGININELTDDRRLDNLSANAALNGTPIAIEKITET